jgi:hypothetical protein
MALAAKQPYETHKQCQPLLSMKEPSIAAWRYLGKYTDRLASKHVTKNIADSEVLNEVRLMLLDLPKGQVYWLAARGSL